MRGWMRKNRRFFQKNSIFCLKMSFLIFYVENFSSEKRAQKKNQNTQFCRAWAALSNYAKKTGRKKFTWFLNWVNLTLMRKTPVWGSKVDRVNFFQAREIFSTPWKIFIRTSSFFERKRHIYVLTKYKSAVKYYQTQESRRQ